MDSKYLDIIYHEKPISKNRKSMPLYKRAAQFMPFSALPNHLDSINETLRLTDEKAILSDDQKYYLDLKLNNISINSNIKVNYFINDLLKEGGFYKSYQGVVKKVDRNNKTIVFYNDFIIDINNIYDIEII